MKKTCGAKMLPGAAQDPALEKLRDDAGLLRVRCDLEPGHDGNHRARTKIAVYEWWNSEKNPQRGMQP